jgi:protein-tyrosine phosphatase
VTHDKAQHHNPQTPVETVEQKAHVLARLWEIAWRRLRQQGWWRMAQYTWDQWVRMAQGAPPSYFSQITPQVFVGGQHSAKGLELLRKRGVTGVVSLRERFDDREAGLAPEAYLHLPTVDDTPPTLEDLGQGVQFIAGQAAAGGATYVHCMLGVGRSPTLVAAYLVHEGATPAKAWARIRSVRPFVGPTVSQVRRVEEYARSLHNREHDTQADGNQPISMSAKEAKV